MIEPEFGRAASPDTPTTPFSACRTRAAHGRHPRLRRAQPLSHSGCNGHIRGPWYGHPPRKPKLIAASDANLFGTACMCLSAAATASTFALSGAMRGHSNALLAHHRSSFSICFQAFKYTVKSLSGFEYRSRAMRSWSAFVRPRASQHRFVFVTRR